LTGSEFLRRWEANPEPKLAELIEGVVYLTEFVSPIFHGERHAELVGLLGVYSAHTPGVVGGNNGTVRLDLDNVPQPDAYLRITPEAGGQAKVDGTYIVGAPEFIAEVAASSASYDLHDKLNAYRRNGVREYVVWRVWDRAVDWFTLHEGRFENTDPGADGIYRSTVLPGLWLDPAAIVAGDLTKALQVLQVGLDDASHQEFATQLKQKLDAAQPS
jgi:Uma2 family endonuclease